MVRKLKSWSWQILTNSFLIQRKKTHKILFCKSSELALGPKILEVFLLTLWPHNESHQEVFSTIPQTDERKTGGTSLLKATVKDPIDARGQSTPDRFVSFYIKTCILQRCVPAKVRWNWFWISVSTSVSVTKTLLSSQWEKTTIDFDDWEKSRNAEKTLEFGWDRPKLSLAWVGGVCTQDWLPKGHSTGAFPLYSSTFPLRCFFACRLVKS